MATQDAVAGFTARVLAEHAPEDEREVIARRVASIFRRSGVESRASVVADFNQTDPAGFDLFPPNWRLDPFPTTADRMAVFERESVRLARVAARRALEDADVPADQVTHLVVTTCTGFFAPGPDVELTRQLELRPSVARTVIGFMGCYAGFTGIRHARDIVAGDPRACVLVVSVELCTLHFQRRLDPSSIIATALFADGAAAALVGAAGPASRPRAQILGTASELAPGSREDMSWRITDHGFHMTLGAAVPARLAEHAGPFLSRLLASAGTKRTERTRFAVHPGGPRILDAVSTALTLDREATASARTVLRRHGNLSSASILFVLAEELAGIAPGAEHEVALLGFGPGLTMEGAVLRTPG